MCSLSGKGYVRTRGHAHWIEGPRATDANGERNLTRAICVLLSSLDCSALQARRIREVNAMLDQEERAEQRAIMLKQMQERENNNNKQ